MPSIMRIASNKYASLLGGAFLCALAAAAISGCRQRSGKSVDRHNVLLITIDTLRADHLSCYGHERIKTPNIDRLAAEGTRFAQCTSAVPITLPSHASIMTATYPFVQGTRVNDLTPLGQANVTLAEILKNAGFVTHAEIASFVMNERFGLNQGFDSYRDIPAPPSGEVHWFTMQRPADDVCDSTIQWLRNHAAQRFFAWVHLFDPHFPYTAPKRHKLLGVHPYDGEILFVDEQIGRLIQTLKDLDIDSKTLVVITADHGEGLWEHDEELHTVFIYDTTLSVPLVFWSPGLVPAGGIVESQVRTIDITPTILDLLGLPGKRDAQGVPLTPLIDGTEDDLALSAYGESLEPLVRFRYAPLRCLRADGWKYIHAPTPELYHVAEDPGETRNLAPQQPQRVQAMREALRQLIAEARLPNSDESEFAAIDEGTKRRLESLGYLTGTRSDDSAGPTNQELSIFDPKRPDPKDRIEAIRWMHEATKGVLFERLEWASQSYRKAIRVDPDLAAAHHMLARNLQFRGKLDEALSEYYEVLRLDPDHIGVRRQACKILLKQEKYEEAIQQLTKVLELDPSSGSIYAQLGTAFGGVNKWSKATEHFTKAVRISPENRRWRFLLAEALERRGKTIEAKQQYREVLRLNPDHHKARQRLEDLEKGAE